MTWWAALALAALIGCSQEKNASSTAPANPTASAAQDDEDDPAKPLTDKQLAEIRKLPDEADQKAAIAQKICPISGQHLGGMGKPVKETVDGHTVFLCCPSCIEDFNKDPQAALAKVSKK